MLGAETIRKTRKTARCPGAYGMALALVLVFLTGTGALAQGPARIISLAPNLTEILYDLELGKQVIAVTGYCNYPPEVKDKPRIGGMSNPSLEAIVALKPELVVLTEDGNPREIAQRLRKLGIRIHIFRARRLHELPQAMRSLGKDLGVPGIAETRAAFLEGELRRYAEKARSSFGDGQKKILFVVQPDPLIVAAAGTTIDDVLKLVGLRNIAAQAKTPYPRLSLEEVIRQSPDIIFLGKAHGNVMADARRLLNRLHHLEAVRQGRVYYLGDEIFRLGPRIVAGMAEIAAVSGL